MTRKEHLVAAKKLMYVCAALVMFHVWTWALVGIPENIGVALSVTAFTCAVGAFLHVMATA